MPPNKTHTMTVDPGALLHSNEALAYGFACYAAERNDVQTLQAFLEAGLDPAVATHSIRSSEGDETAMSPWIQAVQNDALDCVRLVMEWPGVNASRLMDVSCNHRTAMEIALLCNSRSVLDLWCKKHIKMKRRGNIPIKNGFALGGNHALGIAAQFGNEETVRWLLEMGAKPVLKTPQKETHSIPKGLPTFEHFLAWGNCAQVLAERLETDEQCAQRCKEAYSFSSLRLYTNTNSIGEILFESHQEMLHYNLATHNEPLYFTSSTESGGLGVMHKAFADAQSLPAACCPMSPIACALIAESPQVLEVFARRFGRATVDRHAQQTLSFLRGLAKKVVYSNPEKYWEDNQGEAQVERAMSACERWLMGVELGASDPKDESSIAKGGNPDGKAGEASRRRTARL